MRILAALAASYCAAVLAAVYVLPEFWSAPVCVLCLVGTVCAALAVRRFGRRAKLAVLWAAGLALGFGWTAGYRALFVSPARALDGQTVRLTAQVLQWPQETRWGYSVLVRAGTGSGAGTDTLLYTDEQGAALRPGDRIQTVARLSFAGRTSAGEEIAYYTAKGVFLTGRAYGPIAAERPERTPLTALPALLSRGLEESILRAFPEDAGAQILAVVTGNRKNLTQPFTTSLQRAGLSHTAAVSGMHLSFLAGFFSLLLGKRRRRTSLVMAPAVLLFVLAAGCTPSVVRAAVMLLLLLAAPLFGRERDDATALGTAALVLLLQNPLAVAHTGLQLSFAAVAGIFLVSEPVQRRLTALLRLRPAKKWSGRWLLQLVPGYCAATLSATAGALVFTLPLTAIHFSSVSLLAPLSNLLTLWAVAAMFCGGLAVGLTGLACPAAAAALAVPAAPFARYLDETARLLGRFPLAAVTMDSAYYKLWVCLVSACVLAALVLRPGRRLALPAGLCVLSLCAAAALTNLDFARGQVSVTALDVGQGQCVLVRQGRFLTLIDCGGDGYENPGDTAANHIQNTGRGRLDLLVLTHFHDDHANGVPQLLERLDVSAIAMPDTDRDAPLRREILALARERGTEVWLIREDAVLELDGNSRLTLFAPLGGGDVNEQGLTVLASTGEFDALFTGDMGSESELLLLEHAALPDIELLMAGHHGSKGATSQALLDAVTPEYVFLSVGENNRYGHPAPETLERLEGLAVYRTDLQGNLTLRVSDTEG